MGINLGLAGFPYFGSDVAGYMSQGTTNTNVELFHRWVTFGALQPVMRTHHGRDARLNVQWEHDASTIAHQCRHLPSVCLASCSAIKGICHSHCSSS